MDCSLPDSSIHGIIQTRMLSWVAIPFSRGSSWPRDQARISCIASDSLLSEPPREPGVQKCLPIPLCHVQLFSSMISHPVYLFFECQASMSGHPVTSWADDMMDGDQLTLIRAHLFSLLGTEVRLHADLSNGSSRIQLCQSSHCLLDANSNSNFPEVGIRLLIMCWKVGTFLGVDVCECVCESDRERACFLVAMKQHLWVGADSFCSCLASHIKQKPMSLISWGLSSKELCVCVCVCVRAHAR